MKKIHRHIGGVMVAISMLIASGMLWTTLSLTRAFYYEGEDEITATEEASPTDQSVNWEAEEDFQELEFDSDEENNNNEETHTNETALNTQDQQDPNASDDHTLQETDVEEMPTEEGGSTDSADRSPQ